MDHHIVRRDDGNPEIRLFASPSSPQVYVEVAAGSLGTAFHLTRYQVAELITSLQAVDNELAAREVADAPTYREEVQQNGDRLVIASDEGGEAIFGQVVTEDGKTWIGCFECSQEITAADGGMCSECRQDHAMSSSVPA